MNKLDLGAVTAYAMAVEQGYEGTEEEFAALQANSGNNALRAENAADRAQQILDSIPLDFQEVSQGVATLTQDIDNGFALPITWEDGAYINNQGLVIPFDGYSFGTVDVQKIGDISIATVCYDKTTCAFYNDNGVFISAAPFNDSRENPYRLLLSVPQNARYLKFSCMTYAKDDASAKIANVPAQIRAVMGGVGAVTIAGDGQNLTNADEALPNTIYSIQQGGGIVSNLPAEQGTLVTFSYSASEVAGRVQIFVDADNRFFWRIRWQDWRDWREVVDLSEAVIDIRDAINIAVGGALSHEWTDGYYINGYNNGEIPSYPGTPGMSYAKVDVSTIRGCDVTFSTNTQRRATYAFYDENMKCVKGCGLEFVGADGINTFTDAVPFTAKYLCVSSYTDKKTDFCITVWNVSNAASRLYEHLSDTGNPLEHVTGTPGMAAIFRKFCCIGDSLASGEFEYLKADGAIGYLDLYEYSWGQHMARAVGGTCYNLSKGGATTRTWLADFASRLPETLSDCYIVALGVNDANPDSRNVPVGSMADCHATNHTLNADSYYGNYDQIIRRIHSVQPRAKIFCVTNPQGGASAAYDSTYNQAVRDMVAKHDNCYLIDLWAHAPVYDAAFRARYFNGGHMNAAGYLYTAHMFASYIDWHIKNNPTDFAEVAFIGTDYSRQ